MSSQNQNHDSGLLRHQCFIAGNWIDADHRRTIVVADPATGREIGTVPKMGRDEAARAIAAADQALPDWAGRVAGERADILRRWYRLIEEHADDLARLLTLEQGKPLAEARGEVIYAASFVRFYAEEALRVYGETIPSPHRNSRILVLKQPIGVTACITPWNFPAAMITRKVAPALAAGCTAVLKPAGETPFSALALAALGEDAGIPAGVLNVLTGDSAAIGDELCANPIVRKLSFTGSTSVGRLLAAKCAPTIKKLALELGGNAPFIVFDDADLDAAVEGALFSKYRHSGQTCICTNRFLVQARIYDDFAAKFAERVKALKVGNGFEEGIDIGPLINSAAIAKVEEHLEDARLLGAEVLAGGCRLWKDANFFTPTLLGNVSEKMRLAHEETFGPLAALIKFETEEEALALANRTEYGLAGYFYSRDNARVWRVAEALQCGMVGINTGLLSTELAPFGGVKQSGIGREGSRHGLDEFLELKYLHIGGIALH